jgi:hypothetical protein
MPLSGRDSMPPRHASPWKDRLTPNRLPLANAARPDPNHHIGGPGGNRQGPGVRDEQPNGVPRSACLPPNPEPAARLEGDD